MAFEIRGQHGFDDQETESLEISSSQVVDEIIPWVGE